MSLYNKLMICSSCKENKCEDDFYKSNIYNCKSCVCEYDKAYRLKNKEKLKNQKNEYYLNNKEYYKQYGENYYINNKEKFKQNSKEWNINNKEKLKIYNKEYRLNNKEKLKQNKKEYYLNNKEYYIINKEKIKQNRIKNKDKINKYNKEWKVKNKDKINSSYRDRIKNDPAFKLRKNCSRSINNMLKNIGVSKAGQSILQFLPYSFNDLKCHLESLFEPWMNWDNYGVYKPKIWKDEDVSTWTWQIDHIIPQSELKYISMEDENFKKCWALENLRPYSAKQNIIDGASRIRHKK